MIINSQIANALDIAQEKARYEEYVKSILANKYILAYIMQGTIKECVNMSIDELAASIEGKPEINSVQVSPGQFPEAISGDQTECKIPNEGVNYYDIRFHAYIPGMNNQIKLLINVEAQNKYQMPYDLVTRGIFYAARMISAQKDTEFFGDNYDDIKNVYSLWICISVPAYAKNTITEYSIEQKKLYGDFQGTARYDILTVTFICLGDEPEAEQPKYLSMLTTILSNKLEVKEKKHILEQEYQIPMTIDLGREIDRMGNLGDGIFLDGILEGSRKTATENARKFFINGASYELVRASIDILSDEELQEIYDEVMAATV